VYFTKRTKSAFCETGRIQALALEKSRSWDISLCLSRIIEDDLSQTINPDAEVKRSGCSEAEFKRGLTRADAGKNG